MVSGFSVYNILIRSCTFLKVSHNSLVLKFCVKLCLVCFFSNMQYLFICLFILNFLLLFNYSCMPFLPIPPPHPTPAKPLSLPHQIVLVFKVFCSLPNCCVGSLCQFWAAIAWAPVFRYSILPHWTWSANKLAFFFNQFTSSLCFCFLLSWTH